jgi:hypothetical protein
VGEVAPCTGAVVQVACDGCCGGSLRSIASHKSPEARQNLLDILTIIGFILAIMPTIERIADKLDK